MEYLLLSGQASYNRTLGMAPLDERRGLQVHVNLGMLT
jgi:hypothetical protein